MERRSSSNELFIRITGGGVAGGTMLDRPPSFPFCEVGAEKGEDVRKGTAVRSMNGSSCWC